MTVVLQWGFWAAALALVTVSGFVFLKCGAATLGCLLARYRENIVAAQIADCYRYRLPPGRYSIGGHPGLWMEAPPAPPDWVRFRRIYPPNLAETLVVTKAVAAADVRADR